MPVTCSEYINLYEHSVTLEDQKNGTQIIMLQPGI